MPGPKIFDVGGRRACSVDVFRGQTPTPPNCVAHDRAIPPSSMRGVRRALLVRMSNSNNFMIIQPATCSIGCSMGCACALDYRAVLCRIALGRAVGAKLSSLSINARRLNYFLKLR